MSYRLLILNQKKSYRVLALFTLFFAFIGSYAGVGSFFVFRIMFILSMPFFVFNIGSVNKFKSNLFLVSLMVYSLLSLAWCPDFPAGFAYSLVLLKDIIFVFMLQLVYIYSESINQFFYIVFVAYIILLVVSIWEMVTLSHLVVSDLAVPYSPRAFFGNQNDLAMILVMYFPIVFYTVLELLTIKKVVRILLAFSITGLTGLVLFFTMSRGALIAFGGELFIIFLYSKHRLKILYSFLIWGGIVYLLFYKSINEFFFNEIWEVIRNSFNGAEDSDSVRLNFLAICIKLGILTFGLGAGSGGVENLMHEMAVRYSYDVGNIAAPHNFFGELFANYGFVGIILFLTMFLGLIVNCYRYLKVLKGTHRFLCICLMSILVVFPLTSSISSSSFQQRLTWILLGLIIIGMTDIKKHVKNSI